MTSTARHPRVGVAVLVLQGDRVLIGRRRGAHGAGAWGLPGGHLEWGETVEACARREVLEETGLELGPIRCGPFTNDRFEVEDKHYVTLFVLATAVGGELALREPEKCDGWAYLPWAALPAPLFQPLATLRASGFDPTRA